MPQPVTQPPFGTSHLAWGFVLIASHRFAHEGRIATGASEATSSSAIGAIGSPIW
jgi:hypothetical protein